MVVSLNTALNSHSTSGIAFTSSRQKSAKISIKPELIAKENEIVRPTIFTKAGHAIKRAFYVATAALTISSAAPTLQSCQKDLITPDPVTPPTNALDSTSRGFMEVAAPTMAAKSNVMLDSVLVNDSYSGQNEAWKVDAKNSTKDTIRIKTMVLTGDHIENYGTMKFFKDKTDGLWTAKNYYSKNFIYDDPEQIYNTTIKYIKSGDAIITSSNGIKKFKFINLSADEVKKTRVDNEAISGIIKRLACVFK